jgi:hypothetical protein
MLVSFEYRDSAAVRVLGENERDYSLTLKLSCTYNGLVLFCFAILSEIALQPRKQ